MEKILRYCAKYHDSKTGEYVYPGSLPPPQRGSKTELSCKVEKANWLVTISCSKIVGTLRHSHQCSMEEGPRIVLLLKNPKMNTFRGSNQNVNIILKFLLYRTIYGKPKYHKLSSELFIKNI